MVHDITWSLSHFLGLSVCRSPTLIVTPKLVTTGCCTFSLMEGVEDTGDDLQWNEAQSSLQAAKEPYM